MIHAYSDYNIDEAMDVLGSMLCYATHEQEMTVREIWNLFLNSPISRRFASGETAIVLGHSGPELVYMLLEQAGLPYRRRPQILWENLPAEYWAGWAVAYYQWYKNIGFNEIEKLISIEDVLAKYNPYHEMDIMHFVESLDKLRFTQKYKTKLKLLRMARSLSQRELAMLSGIPVRTIQQYEQGQKNINKAQANYVYALAIALDCEESEILEPLELSFEDY